MNPFVIAGEYFVWQYSYGITEFLRAWFNIHWFLFHFFSFPVLLRTMFQPLFRIREDYGRGFDPQKTAEALTINLIMRITGFITRIFLLCIGLVVECAMFVVGLASFVVYLLSPLEIPAAFLIILL